MPRGHSSTAEDANASAAPGPTPLPSQFGSSRFGSTQFEPTQIIGSPIDAARRQAAATLVFDACHVGVVLRAVLFVHTAAAIGVMFAVRSLADWLPAMATASGIVLPALLVWLLVVCLAKRPLARLPELAQRAVSIVLGAACGLFGWSLGAVTGLEVFDAMRGMAPACAGAALAAVMDQWLRLRAQATLPAETTARLAELQSRIRPHFLFNTLNTALSLVRLDPVRAEGVLEDLAELFRVALTYGGDEVSLTEEVELARRYLAIEQIRFGERLKLEWDLDPGADYARLPPLLLQPLVENAVRHGVEPSAAGGTIRVRTRVLRGQAELAITNTVPDHPSQPGNGIALRNVRERLRLMHDVNSQFEARRIDDVFRVRIVVPLS